MNQLINSKITWSLAMAAFLGGATLMLATGDEAGSSEVKPVENAPVQTAPIPAELPATAPAQVETAKAPAHTEASKAPAASPAAVPVRAPASANEHPESKFADHASARATQGSLPDAASIEEIKKQRLALEQREKDLAARETELKAKEQALVEELKKLEVIRDDIAKVDGSRKKENEEKVIKLVETLETMSPKASSQLVSGLDESLAVAAMSKMSTPKLAKILNIMEPAKSSRLTELLAGVIRSKNTASQQSSQGANAESSRAPASYGVADPIGKGGERYDEQNNKQSQSGNGSADGKPQRSDFR